ncbi:hypothetical protein MBEBAB_2094 [Brevundimonas abyssalis TAR-001]|uniref:Uncharacterized protein n=1 Tax=Brevundimonas abyssalis TAR-001 TaxID=1391729 RepID=A0A8E0TRZ9_9CAUL|nr:hypothetical protein MBEBAB_2094 [Brevundimonas abyssalis TAR-001]
MNPTVIAILAVIVGGALTALQGPTTPGCPPPSPRPSTRP